MWLPLWTMLVCACVLGVGVPGAQCARILGVFAHPTTSNSLFVHRIAAALASAGHDVTVYSPVKPPSNCGFNHHLVVTEFGKRINKIVTYEWLVKEVLSKSSFGGGTMLSVTVEKCKSFLEHPKVKQLLQSNETFDLVLTEPFFGEEPLLLFAHKFGALSVSLMPLGPSSVSNWFAGNSLGLAYVPDYIAFSFSDHMTLPQRLLNTLSSAVSLLHHRWFLLPTLDELAARYVSDLPDLQELMSRVSLNLVNAHPSLGYPRPWPTNVVPVGGIHINHDEPPMTQEMQEFMDAAPEGVVYCSLGSIVPAETLPDEMIQAFVNVFKGIKQKVIWKMSEKVFKGKALPKNIMLSNWLPQQRVLAHRNTVLFVTHGGIGSQWETFNAGVPVVGIPFFADQPHNVHLYEQLGVGLGVPLDRLAEDTLYSAVHAVLTEPSFRTNAERVSQIYKDTPLTPTQSAVYWIDYVLRHKGAPHLTPRAATMPWHQRILADVLATVLLAVITLVLVCRVLYRLVCGRYKKNKID